MPYIHFTNEQKQRAASVDLKVFLERQGEKLIRSGPEYRMASDHSITIRGSEWYDHASEEGGGPISFVQNFYNLSYPEAVTRLLEGEMDVVCQAADPREKKEPKPFALPVAGQTMRRLYAYMMQKRLISREILDSFVRAGLIYESCEPSKDGSREYHNAVFVGKDGHGVARHAHKRSISDMGKTFRINVEGSDPQYGFHWNGASDRLYVFEAPIDLLSFVSLYQKDWKEHSYVALCGTSDHAVMWMLKQNPKLQNVLLCLDHDEAGIEASGRLADTLRQNGEWQVTMLQPMYKDWNEDLKARHGMKAQPAEKHPQCVVAPAVCRRIGELSESVNLDRIILALPELLEQYRSHLHCGRFDRAMDCMEQMSALALAACGREFRQLGRRIDADELGVLLCRQLKPHQNRSSIKNRHSEISVELQNVLAKAGMEGLRSQEDKLQLANAWLELAVSCAKIPVKYEGNAMKKQQKQTQEQSKERKMEMR